jgi:hypothetical protein
MTTNNDPFGTPQSLDNAIMNAICMGPCMKVPEQIYAHMKDFLAQKFCIAMLNANEKEAKMLQDLFDEIIRR